MTERRTAIRRASEDIWPVTGFMFVLFGLIRFPISITAIAVVKSLNFS
jgi:hypothetical protein